MKSYYEMQVDRILEESRQRMYAAIDKSCDELKAGMNRKMDRIGIAAAVLLVICVALLLIGQLM